MSDVAKQVGDYGLIPIIVIHDAKNAVPLAKAVLAGGLAVVEVTFRTDAAEESLRRISAEVPGAILGAGTVLTVEQAERAVKAGAKFIVTPGFGPAVVKHCIDRKIPIFPGVATPTDIQMALEAGLNVVKFFPADAFGGIKTLKSISAPFGAVKFVPTGGITAANLAEYILFPKVFACGGSWMVKDDLIKEGKFDEITRLTREAVDIMLGFEVAHVGINTADANAALSLSKKMATAFNMPLKEGNSSNFAGKGIEVNKGAGLGAHGHIAISTNSIPRAVAYLERTGVAVDMSTAKKDASGNFIAVYLKEEFGGFAVHLLQKK